MAAISSSGRGIGSVLCCPLATNLFPRVDSSTAYKCILFLSIFVRSPIAVTLRSKAWVCGRLLAGIAGSNPARGMNVCLFIVVCFQVDVSVTSRSLVQRSLTYCVVSECDHEASIIRRPRPTRAVGPEKKKKLHIYIYFIYIYIYILHIYIYSFISIQP